MKSRSRYLFGKSLHTENKTPIKWRAVLAESAFIGASIILAFALQDWDEEQDIQERTLIALCNVKSELVLNRILIESEYIPRQRGMLALTNAAISQARGEPESEPPKPNLRQMLVQESLRYSAWRLAGESGYLLHANFQLATEIGALIDYQRDRYQVIINQVNDKVLDQNLSLTNVGIDYYASLAGLIEEWIIQTTYLNRKYETLFEREEFQTLQCD